MQTAERYLDHMTRIGGFIPDACTYEHLLKNGYSIAIREKFNELELLSDCGKKLMANYENLVLVQT